jgi:hypothetical protein
MEILVCGECGNGWFLPWAVIIDFISSVFSLARNDRSSMMTASVNLRETIAAISGGMVEGTLSDATRDGHVFPMIIFAILSKQNIFFYCSSVGCNES